jgi:phage terminase large subunit-like protein
VKHLAGLLHQYPLDIQTESGSKEIRALPLAGQMGVGNVVLLRGDWNKKFIEELCGFPNASHDDQVDAASTCYAALHGGSTGMLDWMRQQVEQAFEGNIVPTTTHTEQIHLG